MTENISFAGKGFIQGSEIDPISKLPLNWVDIGNVTMAQSKFAPGNKIEVREGGTGKENIWDSITVRNDGELDLTLTKHDVTNLRRLLFSGVIVKTAGTITNKVIKTSPNLLGVADLGRFNITAVTAVTGQAIASFTVGTGGTGYSAATQVIIAGSGGASAIPVITAGAITGITLISPGLYASAPAISFVDSGGGSGATATAVLSGTSVALTNNVDYTWDVFGSFRRVPSGLIPAGGSVLVTFTFAAADAVGFNSIGTPPEIAIRITGRNKLRADSPYKCLVPRLQLSPTASIDWISIGKSAGDELKLMGRMLYVPQFDVFPIGDGSIPGGLFLEEQIQEG